MLLPSLQVKYGEVTYNTTFEDYTMLTGNVVSLMMGGIICFVWSMIAPEDYDFVSMRQIKMGRREGGRRPGLHQGETFQCWACAGEYAACGVAKMLHPLWLY